MKCPHCHQTISDELIAKHLASKGGKKSVRKITPEQQAKMQAARKKLPKNETEYERG